MDDREFVSPEEQAAALDGSVGAGSPDTAPWESPAVGLFGRQPLAVLWLLAIVADTVLVTVPALPLGVQLGALVVLNVAAAVGAWQRVTPVAAPRLGVGDVATLEGGSSHLRSV